MSCGPSSNLTRKANSSVGLSSKAASRIKYSERMPKSAPHASQKWLIKRAKSAQSSRWSELASKISSACQKKKPHSCIGYLERFDRRPPLGFSKSIHGHKFDCLLPTLLLKNAEQTSDLKYSFQIYCMWQKSQEVWSQDLRGLNKAVHLWLPKKVCQEILKTLMAYTNKQWLTSAASAAVSFAGSDSWQNFRKPKQTSAKLIVPSPSLSQSSYNKCNRLSPNVS